MTSSSSDVKSFKPPFSVASLTLLFVLLVCGVIFSLEIARILEQRSEVLASGKRDTANLVVSLVQHADLSILAADVALAGLADRLETQDERNEGPSKLRKWFNSEIVRLPQLSAFAVSDQNGLIVFGSELGQPHFSVQDREFYQFHRDRDSRELFIGSPIFGRVLARWIIPVSRRYNNADGSFGGVATAFLNLDFFQEFYDQFDVGTQGSIVLLSGNAKLLVRRPYVEANIGRDMSQSSIFKALKHALVDSLEMKAVTDGVVRLNSYRRSEVYPIVVAVARSTDEVLSPWRDRAMRELAEMSILLLIISAGGFFVWKMTTKLGTANLRFDAAINNMPNGLSMFDASERLLVANGPYRKMYGLTENQVKVGTQLKLILENFKSNSRMMDTSREEFFRGVGEREPQVLNFGDGRKILIQRTSMADGGWVATHEDVTEKTRLEASLIEKAADLERVNTHFDAALNSMSQGLCLFDADQRVIVSNLQYAGMYKLSPDQVKSGSQLRDILELRREKGTFNAVNPDLYMNVNVKEASEVQELADGRFVAISRRQMPGGGWLTVHEDITERRMTEQERDRNRAFLYQIIEHIPTQITVKDARNRRYVLLNRVAEGQLGTANDVVGKTAYDIFSEPAADKITKDDDEALLSENGMFSDEHEFERPTGADSRFVTERRVSIRDENGCPAYLINLVEDVTERKLSNDRIAFLAHHDQLTGLPNRARFAEKLDQAAKRCSRLGTPFTVLMLDLDKFKCVNDTLGHPAGDQLLVRVAERLKLSLRDTDVLARLGGDEFAIIQEGESNQREDAIGLALRIIDIIGAPFDLSGGQANIGTSIGIAFATESGFDADSLVKKADLALYEAKSAGRNDYRLFRPEMAEVSDIQKVLEGELREGIQRDEFELYYQPVVDAKSGSTCGLEALVRWRHPTKGLVSPDKFIPLAESTGLMIPLGEWILQRACQDAASWPTNIKVAINISAVQFNNANIFDVVLCALVESGLSPERLELEITETMLLKDEQACLLAIRQLKNLGITIVLDDFGIGYSSSSYLTRVSFDKIKIDKSFVQGFPERRESSAIIQSVLALARGLDMVITAEGVETREQFEALRAAGVDLVQGYLFGRPMPLRELAWNQGSPSGLSAA